MYESTAVYYPFHFPLAPASAYGCWIEDVDGNRFLDLTCMAGAATLGHNSRVMGEFVRWSDRLTTTLDYPTEPRVAFLAQLSEYLAKVLHERVKIHLTGPTGASAVEAALKLCRYKAKRSTILSFYGSYHGMSAGASAVSDLPKVRIAPEFGDTIFVDFPHCLCCPKGNLSPCTSRRLEQVKVAIRDAAAQNRPVAGAIIEPVQGEGGTIPVADGFLEHLQPLLSAANAFVIADEVQSGFGRTGRLFAFEHTSARPDVIVFSKGVSGVGAPMAGIAFKESLDGWPPGALTGTFRGFVPAFASAAAALDLLINSDLMQSVSSTSVRVDERLRRTLSNCCHCGEVRSAGYMFAVDIIHNSAARDPFPELASAIAYELFSRGVLVEIGGTSNNVIRLLPPLTIDAEILAEGVDIVVDAVLACSAKQSSTTRTYRQG